MGDRVERGGPELTIFADNLSVHNRGRKGVREEEREQTGREGKGSRGREQRKGADREGGRKRAEREGGSREG